LLHISTNIDERLPLYEGANGIGAVIFCRKI